MNGDTSAHEGLEAYVVGALDLADRTHFEAHLRTCEACRRERDAYAVVLAALDESEIPRPPAPPRLPVATEVPRLRRSSGALPYALTAAAVAAVFTGIAVPRFVHDRAIASAYAEIARMLATDPVEVALVGKAGITGRAIVGDAHRESGFIVHGLPAAGAGLVYRVWIRGTSARRSPGILDVTSDGLHVLVTPGDVFAHASSIRVMLERERDADTAPRRLVLEGTVS